MKNYKKPDLGDDYSGIETIKKYVKEIQSDYKNSYNEDILGYVLWILDDYKRIKQGDGTNFSRITASPEALAEFTERFANCSDDCPVSNKNICEYKCKKCKEALLAWLKQESD